MKILPNVLSIDVEDWFHILDSSASPDIEQWNSLESRVEKNMDNLLDLLDRFSVKATFFWLGWIAERHRDLVRKCQNAGHEIASHGYGHILAYKVGPKAFRKDIEHAKDLLEDIISDQVKGFRAPGFGITKDSLWAFEVIIEAGYQYDSSVFPASRSHGGVPDSQLTPFLIKTQSGTLLEIPLSVVEIFGRRLSLFGGGYLRLATRRAVKWGGDQLQKKDRPLIIYVHPREIDPHHPRLPLSLYRQFKCYVGLNSMLPKLEWLCHNYSFASMDELLRIFMESQNAGD